MVPIVYHVYNYKSWYDMRFLLGASEASTYSITEKPQENCLQKKNKNSRYS